MRRALLKRVVNELAEKNSRGSSRQGPAALYRECTSFAGSQQPATSSSGREGSSYLWLAVPTVAAAALGTSYAKREAETRGQGPAEASTCLGAPWVQRLAATNDSQTVLSAATMHKHPLLKRDHMFSELHRHEMVEDLVCFFNAEDRCLDYVIQLGKNVCGFPNIMHGGLTAAIIDESFGFLWLSLRSSNQLTFRGPAFTAHLEVEYKQKIPAGRLLLCKTEMESCEGRKLWMKATLRDGPDGKVYATARALFVCPRPQKLIEEGVKYAYNSLFH